MLQPVEGLDLQAVRRLAREEGYTESFFNATSRVVSFAKANEVVERIRINVYYTTGTVGTCINHPRRGRTQLFRRNVTVQQLREIFRNPRIHTGTGYHRALKSKKKSVVAKGPSGACPFPVGSRAYVKGFANCTVLSGVYDGRVQIQYDDGKKYHVSPEQLTEVMEEVVDEETAAKDQLNQIQEEQKQIEEEQKQLEKEKNLLRQQEASVLAILEDFEEQRRRKAEEERIAREKEAEARRLAQEKEAREKERLAAIEAAEIERQKQAAITNAIQSKRDKRGRHIDFWLTNADHVSSCFNETVTFISCGGISTVMLFESGGWACSGGLTTKLYNKLNGRQKSLPKPKYVSIGPHNHYYVEFADGKCEWVGPSGMTNIINNNLHRGIASVAFGEESCSYFVVFKDGWWSYNSIPQGLEDLLNSRNKRSDLKCVSLGPNGEYFLEANNGRAWWGGLSNRALKQAAKFKHRLKYMDFGADDAFLIRYS